MADTSSFDLRLQRLLLLQEAVQDYVKVEHLRINRDVKFLEAIRAGRRKGEAAQVKPIEIASRAAMTDLYDYLGGRDSDDDSRAVRSPTRNRRPPLGGGGTTYPAPPNRPQINEGEMSCHHCWEWGVEREGPTCPICEGKKKLPDQQLSPHFKLSQMLNSATGRSMRIPNDPSPSVIANLRRTCNEILERCISGYDSSGLTVISGYRSEELNDAVGGAMESAHLGGFGADVIPKTLSFSGLMKWLVSSGISHDQFILEPSWIHIGYVHSRTGVQRGENLSMAGGRYFPYAMSA